MIKKLLKNLNFSEKEAQTYLGLLELGSGKGVEIAKKANLNRTTTYDILNVLIKRGLVSKFKKGASTYFHALEPERLLSYLERDQQEHRKKIEKQKQKVQELLPELVSLQNPSTTRPKVQFFEGEKGLREAYEDTLTCRSTMLAYTNLTEMNKAMPNFFPEYFKRRTKAKIPINAIFVQNKDSKECAHYDQVELRETRFIQDKDVTWSPEVKIYNDKMVIASWKEKMAVIIESKEFADLQKTVFNELWKTLPKHTLEQRKR